MVDSQPTSAPSTLPASPVTPPNPTTPPTSTLPPSPEPSPSTLPPEPPQPESGLSRIVMVIIGIVLLIGLLGAGYWFLMYSRGSSNPIVSGSPEPSMAPDENIQVACTMEAKICPDGSSVGRTGPNCEFAPCPGEATSEVCQVAMVPPATDFAAGHNLNEQDQNREWIFSEQALDEDQIFTHMATLNFATTDGLGSGYVPGNVTIQCGANTQGFTNDSLTAAYQQWIAAQNASNPPELALTLEPTGTSMVGGQPADTFTVSGGAFDATQPFYLVALPSQVYLISSVSMSADPFIQDTTQQIFDSITFLQSQ